MLVCRKSAAHTDNDIDRRYSRDRNGSLPQGGPVFVPRRKLTAVGRALLEPSGNHQHLPRMDDVAADPVGALDR